MADSRNLILRWSMWWKHHKLDSVWFFFFVSHSPTTLRDFSSSISEISSILLLVSFGWLHWNASEVVRWGFALSNQCEIQLPWRWRWNQAPWLHVKVGVELVEVKFVSFLWVKSSESLKAEVGRKSFKGWHLTPCQKFHDKSQWNRFKACSLLPHLLA